MKQFFLLTVLFSLFTLVDAQAQGCPSSSYRAAAAANPCPHPATAARAAAQDASIELRVDRETGEASYVRKKVCAATGKVSYTPVEYCSKSGKFINVSPREQECVKSKTQCVTRGGTATRVSQAEKARYTPAQKAACARACPDPETGARASAAAARLVKNR